MAVDPYNKYGFNLFGFKTKAVMLDRENKFYMLESSKVDYKNFILGSSSAHRFVTNDLEEIVKTPVFNYSVQHASLEDYLAFTRHIMTKFKPSLILLQLDFYVLNKKFKTDTRLYHSPQNKFLNINSENNYFQDSSNINVYLTLEAIRDTFRVIGVNLVGQINHEYKEHGNYPKERQQEGNEVKLVQSSYGQYEMDDKKIQLLREIQAICDEHHTRLVVMTTPHSIEHYEGIKKQNLLETLNQFKKEISTNTKEFYDFTNESSVHFSTSEFMRDSSHPNTYLSKLILRKIFLNENPFKDEAFGRRL